MRLSSIVLMVCAARTLAAQAAPAAHRTATQADTSACPSAAIPLLGEPVSKAPADTSRRATPDSARRTAGDTRASASANPSIVLLATARAREVRFAKQPRILVRLCGAVTDSVRVVERRNLPDPVQPGATYRDVYIAVEIMGHLNAECLASKIGVSPTTATSDPCASLSFRDSAQARPVAPRRPQ